MGGSAFSDQLAKEAFPRLPHRVYQALKSRYIPILSDLYFLVTVPVEAPQKTSYGDLDILVADPKRPSASSETKVATFVPHQLIQDTLGAKYVIKNEENRTSNYAVPIILGEWEALGHKADEEGARRAAPNGQIYYQVDIHPCNDKEEFERIKFFNSYGDMGMMLGLVANHLGLRLGVKGLTIPDPPHPHFELSTDFQRIAAFLGLSMETYKEGFQTQTEIFQWVSSMRWFDPKRFFRSTGPGLRKVKPERKMYAEFVHWVSEHFPKSGNEDAGQNTEDENSIRRLVRVEVLEYFNLTSEFANLHSSRQIQQRARSAFSGSQVRDWAEMGEHWKGVKLIMDKVRARVGGQEKIVQFVEKNGEDGLKALVLEVRDELGLQAALNKAPR